MIAVSNLERIGSFLHFDPIRRRRFRVYGVRLVLFGLTISSRGRCPTLPVGRSQQPVNQPASQHSHLATPGCVLIDAAPRKMNNNSC
jgi:hypothetical protein